MRQSAFIHCYVLLIGLLLCASIGGTQAEPAAAEIAPDGNSEAVELYPVLYKGLWGYIDREGEMVIQPRFVKAEPFSEGLACVSVVDSDEGSGYGFIDARGEFVVKPQYIKAESFSDGLSAVRTIRPGTEDEMQPEYVWNYIDRRGAVAIEGDFWSASSFSDGLAVVLPEFDPNGSLCHIINTDGEVLFKSREMMVFPFSDGLAHFKTDNGEGLMNRELEIIVPTGKYLGFEQPGEGIIRVIRDIDKFPFHSDYLYLNAEGEELFEVESEGFCGDFSDGLVRITEDGHLGYRDPTGEWIIEPRFDYASDFHEGNAVIRNGDEWSIIDMTGNIVAGFDPGLGERFAYVDHFRSGMFRFFVPGYAAFLGKDGEILQFPPEGSGLGLSEHLSVSFDNSVRDLEMTLTIRPWKSWYFRGYPDTLAPFRDDETWEWGFANSKGERVIPARFEDAGLFAEGLAPAKENGSYGYVDEKGEFVIPPRFDDARRFAESRARVGIGGKWGFIDSEGELAVEARFDDAQDFREGSAPVKLDGKWGFVSYRGITLIEPKFERAEPFSEELAAVRLDGKWGFINRLGGFAIKPWFDNAARFSGGLAPVVIALEQNGRAGRLGSRYFWGPGWWDADNWGSAQTGFVDKTGELVISSEEFHVTGPFREDRALVARKGWTNEGITYDFIDTKGEFVTDLRLTDALDFNNGRAWVVLPQINVYVDTQGNVIWPVSY